jgi:sec-independent protein translocase protein TatB
MFGLSLGELLLIAVVALLVVGPDKLPGAARAIGKGIRDFRRHTRDLQATIEQDEQLGQAVRELRSAIQGEVGRPPPARGPVPPPRVVPAPGAIAQGAPVEESAGSGPAAATEPAPPPAAPGVRKDDVGRDPDA